VNKNAFDNERQNKKHILRQAGLAINKKAA
jgi:hypothetical protein